MKILITGGAGFIGSHVVDKLIEQGDEVLIIDDLSTGSEDNINQSAKFIKIDIADDKISEIMKEFQPEVIIHLAAQKNVRVSLEDPVFDARVNILGSLNLIDLSHKLGIKKFIFASSGGAIYDENQEMPLTENSLENPMSPYGLAKLTIDKYLKYYYNSHGLEYASLRFANVFGPRQDPKGEAGVVALFFEKLKAGEPAHVFGTGEQTRDFVYVADVVDSIVKSMKVSVNTYLNIGTGSEISINQLYSEQAQVVGSEIEPVNDPAVPGELMRNCLDATQAKDVLSWQPQVSIQQGLEQTWEWFKNKKS